MSLFTSGTKLCYNKLPEGAIDDDPKAPPELSSLSVYRYAEKGSTMSNMLLDLLGEMPMTTKKQAHSIIDSLNEEQLQSFVTIFGIYLKDTSASKSKRDVYRSLTKKLHSAPDLDYDAELEAYRNERYNR